jgi:signal peptidase I
MTKPYDHPPRNSALRENIEAVAMAVVLALIIRQYVFEAFKIPTGSMAPTLLGEHVDVTCPNCGYRFSVGAQTTHAVTCQTCGSAIPSKVLSTASCTHWPAWPKFIFRRGEYRILVNKFYYDYAQPQRWDIAVFHYPGPGDKKDYVKRIAGLPGEKIMIRRGDIYANGVIARKPPEVQAQVWIREYDMALQKTNPTPVWLKGDGKRSALPRIPKEVVAIDKANHLTLTPDGSNEAVFARVVDLAHNVYRDCSINNSLPYNGDSNEFVAVGDIRIEADVVASGTGELMAVIRSDSSIYRARFAVGKGKSALFENDVVRDETSACLVPGQRQRIAFEHYDGVMFMYINGQKVAQYVPEPQTIPPLLDNFGKGSGFEFAVNGASADFSEIKLSRDIYYTDRAENSSIGALKPTEKVYGLDTNKEMPNGETIPDGSYFMLGDNSTSSSDSRFWGWVKRSEIVGKSFLVWWPPGQLQSEE